MKRLTSWASQHRSGLLLLLFLAVAAPFSSTITQIVAGNGLTGGGNGGSVSIALNAPVSKANGGTANPTVYCVYYDGSNNVTSEATASFAILPGQTWEMPTYSGIVEYTGPINCATSTSTGSVQALQVL